MYISPPWPPEMDADATDFGRRLQELYEKHERVVDVLGWVRWGSDYRVHRANGFSHLMAWIQVEHDILTIWGQRPANGPPAPPPATGPARVIKVADAGQGPWHPRMYSYWSNAWVDALGTAYIFAGSQFDNRVKFFFVNRDGRVGRVDNADWDATFAPYPGTTEGWSWSPEGWIHLVDGPWLRRVNPFSGEQEVIFDITTRHPGCVLWQSHSEGDVHCATVQRPAGDGPDEKLGVVARHDGNTYFFPATGRLDESMISGDWLVIKEERERDGKWRLDNRVVNLATGHDFWLLDEDGAHGHSDGEGGLVVGEDDSVGACTSIQFAPDVSAGKVLFSTWNMGHVSLRGGRCLVSNSEIIGEVALDGSGGRELVRHGVTATDYDSQVKANLDPSGRVAVYMAHGSIYLLVL